ncbi:signal recognition particle-docking protein FtsY [Natrialbaceae archaeon AArc-T1-2]|uniref:signal recognition particle-docking protein FtsY n=1 Tax=Natrialbaceae archaeon AArc-T1-2 TaxID=3053904 RepID=UPI00255B1317|nr:signal recognition particle-docking protein FtsY [Natrialbaceae archaeon AArc-T1-2]WIV68512.1 signal recognition particle-docking protein FtsY [Natrialbaceae archaeon AArc-T1-2]
MFDSLKEKLGSFREDVEETAEEKAEPVDEDDLEDAEFEDAEFGEAEREDTAAGEEPAESTVPTADDPTSVDTETTPADEADAEDERPDAATADADEADVEESDRDGDDEDGESGNGLTRFGRRAKSLINGSNDTDESVDEQDTTTASDETSVERDVTDDVAATPDDEADEAEDDADEDEPTENNSTGFGRKAKSLVRGKFVIEEDDLEGPLDELELALLSSDVEMSVAEEILENIRDELVGETRTFTTSTGDVVTEALREAILDVISVGQFDFVERVAVEDKPLVIVFTGVNGVGKTTSIAKMSRYLEERGYSTVMANGDTYRAGANEQIEEHADALDTKLITHEQGGDPAAVLYDAVEYAEANDVDVVLGDTAGRLHTDEGLMDQLEKIDRVVDPDMTLFVDEAVAGQDAVNRAREFDDAAEIDGAILTKADADSNGGAAISIAHVTGKPILFLGVGQGYDDIERFEPERMADRLLEEE